MGRDKEILKYLNGMYKLTEMELEYMRFIWSHPEGVVSKQIYEHFNNNARGTIATILHRISDKGYLDGKQIGLHFHYTATVSEEAYEKAVLQEDLDKLTVNRSLEYLVTAFYGKDKLNSRQKDKINDLLKEFEDELDDN